MAWLKTRSGKRAMRYASYAASAGALAFSAYRGYRIARNLGFRAAAVKRGIHNWRRQRGTGIYKGWKFSPY